jgi:hypothetical protein
MNVYIDSNINFQTQMEFVKERNKIRYENKLMKEEDDFSQKSQQIFHEQKQKEKIELERNLKEQSEILEQIAIQSQIEKELTKFVNDYVISRMNSSRTNISNFNNFTNDYPDLNINNLRKEGELIFYERLLKRQQDEEYQKSIEQDMKKYK